MEELKALIETQYRRTLNGLSSEEDDSKALRKLDVLNKHLVELEKAANEQSQIYDNLTQKQKELELREKELKLKQDQIALDLSIKEKELAIREKDLKEKSEQAKMESLDRKIQTGVTMGTTLFTSWLTWHWMKKALKFEETGTFVSRTPKFISDIKRLFGK